MVDTTSLLVQSAVHPDLKPRSKTKKDACMVQSDYDDGAPVIDLSCCFSMNGESIGPGPPTRARSSLKDAEQVNPCRRL